MKKNNKKEKLKEAVFIHFQLELNHRIEHLFDEHGNDFSSLIEMTEEALQSMKDNYTPFELKKTK